MNIESDAYRNRAFKLGGHAKLKPVVDNCMRDERTIHNGDNDVNNSKKGEARVRFGDDLEFMQAKLQELQAVTLYRTLQ